jgi:hypothetical protein
MASALEDFITAQNISLYRSLLKTEMQPGKRRILLELLETELTKLPEALKRVGRAKDNRWSMISSGGQQETST